VLHYHIKSLFDYREEKKEHISSKSEKNIINILKKKHSFGILKKKKTKENK
jgi:hypothetical protein